MCTTPCTRYILYYWPINKCWSIYLPNTWVMFSCMTARVESQNFGVTNEFSRLPHVHPAYPLFTAQPRSFYTLFFTLLCRERRSHGMILYFRGDQQRWRSQKKVYARKKKSWPISLGWKSLASMHRSASVCSYNRETLFIVRDLVERERNVKSPKISSTVLMLNGSENETFSHCLVKSCKYSR